MSLAEWDKYAPSVPNDVLMYSRFIVEQYPVLNHKPALMRAYKKTTERDGDGDPWVCCEPFGLTLTCC